MAIVWDANTDYQDMINKAVAKGDYNTAAVAEQQRNAKIQGTGITDRSQTTNYANYLKGDYVGTGTYNDAGLDSYGQQLKSQLEDIYYKGQSLGDQSMMDYAHNAMEEYRKSLGYSGGADGSENIRLNKMDGTAALYPSEIRAATSQESYINDLYKAQQEAALAALKAAYDQNIINVDAAAAKIPQTYQAAKNRSAADAAIASQNFNEYAAASRLNTGAGCQAQLALANQSAANLSSINQAEAQAVTDLETERLRIQTAYQNDIAQAIAEGDLQKAAALYQEAVRVDESLVAQSQAQADENYRAWAANNQFNQANRDFAQAQLDAILAAGGTPPQSLIAASGYDPAYISAMQSYYAPVSYTGGTYTGNATTGNATTGTSKYEALVNMLGYQMNNTATEKTGVATSYSAFKDAVNNAYIRGEITKSQKTDLLENAKLVKYWGIE